VDLVIDISWCAGALFVAWAAWMKARAGSQPKGAWLVVGLAVVQIVAVIAGFEKLAYLASIATVAIALLLIQGERRWKSRNQKGKGTWHLN
jgi:hypothetical protein